MKKIEKICMLIAGIILVPTVFLVAFILIADVKDFDYSNVTQGFAAAQEQTEVQESADSESAVADSESAVADREEGASQAALNAEEESILPKEAAYGESAENPESVQIPEKGGSITQEKYDQIQNGMSYREVADLIGEEGNKTAESETLGSTTVMYEWKSEEDWGTAIVVLQDNRVINKSQTGSSTESVTTVPVTLSQYNEVEEGMTYDKVVEIFGGDGEVVSEGSLADAASAVYIWKGADGVSNATITFYNNAVFSKAQTGLQ